MKKIIKLTESDLIKIVNRVISEQGEQKNYQQMAETLFNSLKGFDIETSIFSDVNDTEKEKQIIDIVNQINTEDEWKKLKDAFGKRRGRTLEEWLKGDLSDFGHNRLMTALNKRMNQEKNNIATR
jgi:hypothetical protein